jgi:hypothetical protein
MTIRNIKGMMEGEKTNKYNSFVANTFQNPFLHSNGEFKM